MTEERMKIVVAALAVAIAGILAATGHDGWGWFLFAAVSLVAAT